MINIVLLEPEIPHNTGAIGRSCVATNSKLHLIKPLGFKLDDKLLKRAGLDYWKKLDVTVYENYEEFLKKNNFPKVYMATTKAEKTYCDVKYDCDSYIMFGKESAGIPEEILIKNRELCVRIPMWGEIRSLNLANSASIIMYEAYRQIGFKDFECSGKLHRLDWE